MTTRSTASCAAGGSCSSPTWMLRPPRCAGSRVQVAASRWRCGRARTRTSRMTASGRAALELGLTEPPDPEAPGPFRLSGEGALEAVLSGAGLSVQALEDVPRSCGTPRRSTSGGRSPRTCPGRRPSRCPSTPSSGVQSEDEPRAGDGAQRGPGGAPPSTGCARRCSSGARRAPAPSAGSRASSRRWGLDRAGKALVTLLFLRGAQTAGELRTRGERLHPFASLEEAEGALRRLAAVDEPLVVGPAAAARPEGDALDPLGGGPGAGSEPGAISGAHGGFLSRLRAALPRLAGGAPGGAGGADGRRPRRAEEAVGIWKEHGQDTDKQGRAQEYVLFCSVFVRVCPFLDHFDRGGPGRTSPTSAARWPRARRAASRASALPGGTARRRPAPEVWGSNSTSRRRRSRPARSAKTAARVSPRWLPRCSRWSPRLDQPVKLVVDGQPREGEADGSSRSLRHPERVAGQAEAGDVRYGGRREPRRARARRRVVQRSICAADPGPASSESLSALAAPIRSRCRAAS